MLVTAADRAELARHVKEAEASGRAGHPLVKLLRRIAAPAGMFQVTLPKPISANVYWRTRTYYDKETKEWRAMTYVSADAKQYKESAAWLLAAAGVRSPYVGRVAAHIAYYPHRPKDYKTRQRKDPLYWADTVARLDLDNCRKVLTDALSGVAFVDDKCIWMDGGEVMEPDGRDTCVVLTLWPLVLEAPQATLMLPDPPKAIKPPDPVPALSTSTPIPLPLPF